MRNACAVDLANDDQLEDEIVFYDQLNAETVALRLAGELMREWAFDDADAPRLAHRLLRLVQMAETGITFGAIEAAVLEIRAISEGEAIGEALATSVRAFASCLLAQWSWNRGIAPIA